MCLHYYVLGVQWLEQCQMLMLSSRNSENVSYFLFFTLRTGPDLFQLFNITSYTSVFSFGCILFVREIVIAIAGHLCNSWLKMSFSCHCAADGLAFGNSVYSIRFDDDYSEKASYSYSFKHLVASETFLKSTSYKLHLTFSFIQKFNSSSPFGIKYQFHLEVSLLYPPCL